MKTHTIRLLEKEDDPVIAGIIRAVLTEFKITRPGTVYHDRSTDDLYNVFTKPRSEYWILELGGKTVGGGGIYPTDGLPAGCCELVKMYLLPEARGKGFGKQMIEQCFQSALKFGYKQIYIETMPELKTAMGIYEKNGFIHLPGPLGNSGHFGCDLWMLKTL